MNENFYQKGCKAAMEVGERWPELCRMEVENTELKCREERTALKALYHKLKYKLGEIDACLSAGPGERPLQVVQYNFRIGIIFLLSTLFLIAAESLLMVWSFDPFQEIGLKKYVIAAAITFLGFLIFERILNYLEHLLSPRKYLVLKLYLAVGAGIMAVVAILGLALVRGFLFEALIGSRMVTSPNNNAAMEFYERSGPLMVVLFVAMAVAFALGGGLIMREASDRITGSRSVLNLYKKKEELQNLMTEIPSSLERLEVLPKICENEFSRGAVETLERMRRREESTERHVDRRLLIGLAIFMAVFLVILLLAANVFAGEVVIAGLDTSLSQNAVDHRGEREFDKNLKAVREQVIPKLRPSSVLYLMGITGNSFSSPYYILKAITGPKPGYFGELLKRDIQGISKEWEKISKSLKPTEKHTDIFGFLSLAEMISKTLPAEKKSLLVFSDMRHSGFAINLERRKRIDPEMLGKLKDKIHIPDLEGVNIYIYGVHCSGKSDLYYHDLRRFWLEFFTLTKGNLRTYSNLREVNLR